MSAGRTSLPTGLAARLGALEEPSRDQYVAGSAASHSSRGASVGHLRDGSRVYVSADGQLADGGSVKGASGVHGQKIGPPEASVTETRTKRRFPPKAQPAG